MALQCGRRANHGTGTRRWIEHRRTHRLPGARPSRPCTGPRPLGSRPEPPPHQRREVRPALCPAARLPARVPHGAGASGWTPGWPLPTQAREVDHTDTGRLRTREDSLPGEPGQPRPQHLRHPAPPCLAQPRRAARIEDKDVSAPLIHGHRLGIVNPTHTPRRRARRGMGAEDGTPAGRVRGANNGAPQAATPGVEHAHAVPGQHEDVAAACVHCHGARVPAHEHRTHKRHAHAESAGLTPSCRITPSRQRPMPVAPASSE